MAVLLYLFIFVLIPDYSHCVCSLLRPLPIRFAKSPLLVGALTPNNALDTAVKLWPYVRGPESIAIHDGWLYTSTADGNVVRMKQEQHEHLIRKSSRICNRPLGIRINNQTEDLYVVDNCGLHKFSIQTKTIETLFNALIPLDGKPLAYLNDLTISDDGHVYFTDSSYKWKSQDLHLELFEMNCNGRILHYDPVENQTKMLLDSLYFPNGIQLSPDGDFFVFSETTRFRIRRYYLKGPKKGKLEIFANNLPGIPDNIRLTSPGTYWVALAQPRFHGNFNVLDMISPHSGFRYLAACLPYLFISPLKVSDFVGITYDAHNMANAKISQLAIAVSMLAVHYNLIIEIDNNGNVIRSLHSPIGKLPDVTQVTEYKGSLYLGSLEYGIWRVKL